MLNRTAYQRSAPVDADGYMAGTWIRPGSLPYDRIKAYSLESIVAYMGNLWGGTATFGDASGAHTIIGDDARGGLQMYQAPNMLVFSASPQNGGTVRIGALNAPGITMVGGDVQIDGDVMVDGTIRAHKLLFVGGLSYSMMTHDRLFIGGGDPDVGTQSGFLATSGHVGGWNNGVKTWNVNTRSGQIETLDPTNPDYTYTIIGSGLVTISNLDDGGEMVDRHAIKFKGYQEQYIDHGPIAPGEIVTFQISEVDMFAYGSTLVLMNSLDGSAGAAGIRLLDGDRNIRGAWAGHMFTLYDRTMTAMGWLEQETDGTLSLQTASGAVQLTSLNRGSLTLGDNDFNARLDGLSLAFRSGTTGWPARSATPSEGDHRYDAVNHREEFYNGTEWRYLQDAAA